MAEEKQQQGELDQKVDKPPDAPPDDISTSPEGEDVRIPEMEISRSKTDKREQPESQVEGASKETIGSESPDLGEDETKEGMVGMPGKDTGVTPDGVDDSPDRDDQAVVEKPSFEQLKPEDSEKGRNINMLLDVTLPVSIELGRTNMAIEDILNLGPGSVVELDKLAGEPVDLLVNNKLLAKGEVVVVDENFGVRVTSMVSPEERIRSLK